MVAIKALLVEKLMTKSMFGADMTEVILISDGQKLKVRTMDVARSRIYAGEVLMAFPEGVWGISAGEKARDVFKGYGTREVIVKADEAVMQLSSADKPKKHSKIPVEADITKMLNKTHISFLMGPEQIMFYDHNHERVVNEVPTPCKFECKAKAFKDALNAPIVKDAEKVTLRFFKGTLSILGEDDAGFKEAAPVEGKSLMSPASAMTSTFVGLKELAKTLDGDITIAMGDKDALMVFEDYEGIISSYGVLPFLQ